MRKPGILLFSLLSVACVSNGYHPNYIFNQLQVVNFTGTTITNVNLQIGGSDRAVSCDKVAKNAVCNKFIGKRRYPQQVNELSWTHGDGTQKLRRFSPKIAAYYDFSLPLRLMVEVHEDGSMKAYFEQDGEFNR